MTNPQRPDAAASDERARKILLDAYWTPSGRRSEQTVSQADFAVAKAAGYMFEPEWVGHDLLVERARANASDLLPKEVGDAFAASLSTRRLELRSALGSFAIARLLPDHEAVGDVFCSVCGTLIRDDVYDANVLSFERIKWGGVRHDKPEYQAFDLARFSCLSEPRPTEADWAALRRIVEIASSMNADARPGDLDRALKGVLKSNSAERRILIQILAYAGVLDPSARPGFSERFVPARLRDLPPVVKIDWTYPAAWWRGSDGVNLHAVRRYFPTVEW